MIQGMLGPSLVAPERLRRLTRAEYDSLIKLGFFDEDERIELLYGMLVKMSPIGGRHNFVVSSLTELLVLALAKRAMIRPQCSFAASDDSEPEPDIAVVAPGDYIDDHPTTAWLVVEVAESSLDTDRGAKGALYATSNVLEYWIVNVENNTVEVYRDPSAGRYKRMTTHGRGDRITLVQFPDLTVNLDDVLPPR